MPSQTSYPAIFKMAWPIILANAAVPLLGLVDTAVIGNLGDASQIGAIAMGSLIFSFIYWSFGFLRMSTTGFTAQALGANKQLDIAIILIRALLLSLIIGAAIIFLQWPTKSFLFYLFSGSQSVESYASSYFSIRIWGAPATLAIFALMGTLIGLGKSREVLVVQIFLNGINITLDIFFAGYLGWGVSGIAFGTLISEWITVFFAGAIVYKTVIKPLNIEKKQFPWQRIIDRDQLIRMILTNRDIFIRTVFLIFSFAWFTNHSAQFGDVILAANHILLQFISFSAFFLDGFAFVAEALVGASIGSKNVKNFDLAIQRSTILAFSTSIVLALLIFVGGQQFIAWITDINDVRQIAGNYLGYCALYILFSFAAFQLDGIFIGAVRSAQMRNASVVSTLLFLLMSWPLATHFGNSGLWWAFILYVICRALALGFYYPRLRTQFNPC